MEGRHNSDKRRHEVNRTSIRKQPKQKEVLWVFYGLARWNSYLGPV